MSLPIPGNAEPAQLLRNELTRRLEKNPRLSLRSVAQDLGISHSLLSLILSGQRKVTDRTWKKARERLLLKGPEEAGPFRQISLDTFALLSDWYHYAILSLLELPESRLNSTWIATQLEISPIEARLAIDRLKRLGLIAKKSGRWKQTGLPLKVENTVSTEATRRHHRQLLRKAEESLDRHPFETRDFSSITLALDPACLPHARERIRKFRRQLMSELEAMGNPKAVYHLSVQLYPVSKLKRKETP